ncbi:hypothetical protein [Actinomycetospora cinnamomea]|uniref:DUF3592 domain-containing protein n=1 Tax=Actinomycetospora cinnamomea TaxID=663609 RepID=A0A2U1FBI7_9PSEU|nr:hypothetical protein [Actinomycetospora cinnamomea]PVZ09350.1 hypothetical protein C8D89_1065 [Actinomycetospora cinnamomea]
MSVPARRLVPALAALVVVLAPVVGNALGALAARSDDPRAHRAVATVLAHGPVTYPDENALVPYNGVVRAQWTDGEGRSHVGDLYLPERPDVGETRRIWIDRHGAPTAPPLDQDDLALVATLVLTLVGVAVGVVPRGVRERPW